MKSTLQRSFFLALLVMAPLTTEVVACSGQGEGERCEHKNGNDDCQEGLVCKSSKDLGGNADICCPTGQSTNPECIPGGATSSTGTGTSSESSSSAGGAGSSSSSSEASSVSSTASSSASSSSSSGAGGAGGASSSSSSGGG